MAILFEYFFNGAVLGIMYALVAVGFTLFFGVLDVIKFSHGDVLTLGAFSGLVAFLALQLTGLDLPVIGLVIVLVAACIVTGLVGAAIGQFFVIPMRNSSAFNILLMTLMIGTAIREAIRLFYPTGANPKAFPALLPNSPVEIGGVFLRLDSLILLALGFAIVFLTHWLIRHTKLGLAIRAVAQDGDTAQVMGIPFKQTVLATFALGSMLAGIAGVMHGIYYSEINFGVGLLLGIIGFSAAVLGGLGSIWGAIIGGFAFAALQTIWVVLFPDASGYRDVFAFAAIIVAMTIFPTGIIAERYSERV
ncbi:MAG: branched-chain amino acid ABC transporter permease [Rhizobiales bacterium 62-47]|nr:branched-chain amino acid ABC transporter permease [Hyphomicrobiales bacterium]OJY08938.1 MAG: branched-chain amino acid ABC transporter permease [Rhizobiales bacterium 62-47]